MEIQDLVTNYSDTTEKQKKAIFSTLFIAGNRLQTLFDSHIPELTLKQFMLLTMVRQSKETLTFTQLGRLLGCSRQNIKKLAQALEQKGFVVMKQREKDSRSSYLCPTGKVELYFKEKFFPYVKDLDFLFEVYSPEEIRLFFQLMIKLYDGIEHMEKHYE